MKYNFNTEQIDLLCKMNIPFNFMGQLTDDEDIALSEIVSDYFQKNGGVSTEINKIGFICEGILDIVNSD